jgi:NDP-sugar pyrophosphorylase family protein
MAGFGSRFKDAGYMAYKPFIPIAGQLMVNWALDPFPEHVQKHLIVNASQITPSQKTYLESLPNVNVIEIPEHKLGPAYSIVQAKEHLPLDASFIVTYLDIFWSWDYDAMLDYTEEDGIVFTRRRFHPHLIHNNFSAFCRTEEDSPNRLAEIREKASFTDNWMTEPLSVGAFYFKHGQTMMSAFEDMVNQNEKVANEFFPSVAMNRLVQSGRSVALFDVDFFVHWGTPEQLEDVAYWTHTNWSFPTPEPVFKEAVCCMGGTGSRMQGVSPLPKALIPFFDNTMMSFVNARFPAEHVQYIVTDDMKEMLGDTQRDLDLYSIGEQTNSQIETLIQALPLLKTKRDFFLTSCDAFGEFHAESFKTFVKAQLADAVIFTFDPTLTQKKLGKHHSYVTVEGDGSISAVHVKSKQSESDKGLAGFFWFREGTDFEALLQLPQHDRELCVDDLLKHLVASGKRVFSYPLDRYYHIGTPEEYFELLFWYQYRDTIS